MSNENNGKGNESKNKPELPKPPKPIKMRESFAERGKKTSK